MPIAPGKPCRHYRCGNMQGPNGFCTAHEAEGKRKDSRKLNSRQRGYSAAWSKFAAIYRRRNPICQKCGKAAFIIHHIRPLSEGGQQFDEGNLMSLCFRCHEAEHGRRRP
jgi:5-methylcytosine-specific restriction protein A